MKNKVLATLLALSLAVGCLAGCGSSKDGESSAAGENSKTQETASQASSGEEEDSNFNETGYPIVDEPVTLKMYTISSETDPNEFEFFKMMEELTNVHIEWTTIPAGDGAQERLNLMWASGEYPDAVVAGSTTLPSISREYLEDGIIIPVNDLIDKYMPNLKEHAGEYLAELTYPDGNIYGFPEIKDYYYMGMDQAVCINTDWLENLNLEMPTTTDEFREVLRAFKEQDANGNGDPNDEIPYSAVSWKWQTSLSMITGAFTYPLADRMLVVDGVVIDPACEDGLKDAIKYLRELYAEGLIDQEIFTQEESTYMAKCKEDPVIVGSSAVWRSGHSFGDDVAEESYVTLPPLTGPDGKSGIYASYVNVSLSTVMYITNACEYPEVLARWIDTLYDPIISLQSCYGPLDTALVKTEEGYLSTVPEGYSTLGEYLTGNHLQHLPQIVDSSLLAPDERFSVQDKIIQDKVYVDSGALYYGYPRLIMETEEQEEVDLLKTDIAKYQEETICRWISGQGDVDAEWDEYIATLNNFGHERYLEIHQQAYDRYLANN